MDVNQGGKEVFITGHSGKDSWLWTGANVGEIRTVQAYRWLQDLDSLMQKFIYTQWLVILVSLLIGSPYYSEY